MYATQSNFRVNRQSKERTTINKPCQLMILEDQIHKFPDNIRKSIRQNKHKHRVHFNKGKNAIDREFSANQEAYRDKDNINLSICRIYKDGEQYRDQQLPIIKHSLEFSSTADRMFNLRRRLSPNKRIKQESRGSNSVDSVRDNQRITFLNIQKLQLVKIYDQIDRETDNTEQIQIDKNRLSPSKQYEMIEFKEAIINIRRTLREGKNNKWAVQSMKNRPKPFILPFDRYYYRDFIWKVAFSNGLILIPLPQQAKLKVYVGRGNNSQLVRSLLKRRGWWTFTQKWEQANLIWTQLKVNSYFQLQSIPQLKLPEVKKIALSEQIADRNELNLKIMNEQDVQLWDNYWRSNRILQDKLNQDMGKRNNCLKKAGLKSQSYKNIRIQNHFPNNYLIGNKKALLYTMTQFYQSRGEKVFQKLPLSFHIKIGIEDSEYSRFLARFYERKKQAKKNNQSNAWIVKPGQLTNRGQGIVVCLTLDQIKSILKRRGQHRDGTSKTFILQEYIERPFLYQRRKFDIRHYMLATCINGRFKGYWFKRGYIRTSSSEYTLNHSQAGVHLTNDAVQKLLPQYGKYQKGNKLSYQDFQAYLQKQHSNKYDFFSQIYPKMKAVARDSLRASASILDPLKRTHNFELFGLDFMIDGSFQPWLIEINSNPCLQLSCPLLADIIPALIENTLRICVDSLLPPPAGFQQKRPRFLDNALLKNQFELVYDSSVQQHSITVDLLGGEMEREQDEQFDDDGQALQD